MFQRETLIALRARREAHRVANDVALPPLDVERPPAPPTPPADPETVERAIRRHESRLARGEDLKLERKILTQMLLALLLIFGVVLVSILLTSLLLSSHSK